MRRVKPLRAKPLEALFHRTSLAIYVSEWAKRQFFMSCGTPGTFCGGRGKKLAAIEAISGYTVRER
jgi:hypothetical protein